MKQIEVRILQQSYLLVCPEGHEPRLMAAVDRVDAAMTRIRDAGKVRARERIAVLAAVNMAFELGDREAADQAAANERPPAPGQGTLALDDAQAGIPGASGQAPEHAAQQQERLQSLLQRLDAALHGAQQPA
jgi:cell division protein ZapA